MHQALAAVEHQFRLRLTPAAERRGPLLGPAHVEHLLASLDHRAVQVADRNRRDLPRRDRHHGVVEQCHALGDLPEVYQAAALTNPGQSSQLRIVIAVADSGSLSEAHAGARWIALERQAERGDIAQVSPFNTVPLVLVEQPLRPVDPPAAAGQVPLVQQDEGRPERATGGTGRIAEPGADVMSTRTDVDALLVPADQKRSNREPLQVLELERCVMIRGRQLRPRVSPGLPPEGLTAPIDRTDHGPSLVPCLSLRRRRRRGPRAAGGPPGAPAARIVLVIGGW